MKMHGVKKIASLAAVLHAVHVCWPLSPLWAPLPPAHMLLLFQICYTGSVVTGPCSLTDGGLCATSPNYPFEYGNNERCTISGVPAYRLYTVAFDVERCGSVCFCDSLIVNGKKYCGRLGPEGEVHHRVVLRQRWGRAWLEGARWALSPPLPHI